MSSVTCEINSHYPCVNYTSTNVYCTKPHEGDKDSQTTYINVFTFVIFKHHSMIKKQLKMIAQTKQKKEHWIIDIEVTSVVAQTECQKHRKE